MVRISGEGSSRDDLAAEEIVRTLHGYMPPTTANEMLARLSAILFRDGDANHEKILGSAMTILQEESGRYQQQFPSLG